MLHKGANWLCMAEGLLSSNHKAVMFWGCHFDYNFYCNMCIKYSKFMLLWNYSRQIYSHHFQTFKPKIQNVFCSQHLDYWVKTTWKHHLFLTKRSTIYFTISQQTGISIQSMVREQKKIKKTCYSSRNQINNGSTVEFLFPERYWNNEIVKT